MKHQAVDNITRYNATAHRRTAYGTWKCRFCGQIFITRNKRSEHTKNVHSQIYRVIWNKGLTAQTSATVKLIAEKNKTSLKGKSHPLSKETRARISKSRSLALAKRGHGGFTDIKWYDVKNLDGKTFVVRGTWE